MKVEFRYVSHEDMATGKKVFPSKMMVGHINLERSEILVNAALTPFEKIGVLIHELAHYFNYHLFWRVFVKTGDWCELSVFADFIDDFLDYREDRAELIVDSLRNLLHV
jgi:predicted SprT family Zn-dependent metalloprotease